MIAWISFYKKSHCLCTVDLLTLTPKLSTWHRLSSPTTDVIKCILTCKSILTLSPTHTIKSSLFPFAMHECTQHMLTWRSFYGTVDAKYHYSIIKHEISLRTIKWRHQRINTMQYCLFIIFRGCSSPSETAIIYNLPPTICFNNNLPQWQHLPKETLLLDIWQVSCPASCAIFVLSHYAQGWTLWELAATYLYCKWVYVTSSFEEETEFSELGALVCSIR